jgi:hypothetical protein
MLYVPTVFCHRLRNAGQRLSGAAFTLIALTGDLGEQLGTLLFDLGNSGCERSGALRHVMRRP